MLPAAWREGGAVRTGMKGTGSLDRRVGPRGTSVINTCGAGARKVRALVCHNTCLAGEPGRRHNVKADVGCVGGEASITCQPQRERGREAEAAVGLQRGLRQLLLAHPLAPCVVGV
jgi:hypothetical protein